jgi:tRNA-2-methylthio-N6-dimethylallyladenosine synthase
MSGRAPDNRLVHFTPEGTEPRPGDLVTVTISRAAPHYLVADGAPAAVRRTRAGDAWEKRLTGRAPDFDDRRLVREGGQQPVVLGMPALSRPV